LLIAAASDTGILPCTDSAQPPSEACIHTQPLMWLIAGVRNGGIRGLGNTKLAKAHQFLESKLPYGQTPDNCTLLPVIVGCIHPIK